MTLYYAKSTNGFYNDEINVIVPDDAVEISETQHAELLEAQSSGKNIQSDKNGNPVVVDVSATPLSPLQQAITLLHKGVFVNSKLQEKLIGTYAVDSSQQTELTGLMLGIMLTGTFPNNMTTYDLHDINGDAHTFPDVTTFKNFYLALLNYLSPITQYLLSNGESGSLPKTNSISIA